MGFFTHTTQPDPAEYSAATSHGPALAGPVMMSQWWRRLVFIHWRVPPEVIAPLLPAGVRPDTWDGSAWVGLIPFCMEDAAVGRGPGVPFFGTFLELNIRTYGVDEQGRHGVVFLTLEADRLAVMLGARVAFGLPYRYARMRHEVLDTPTGPVWEYSSKRWTRTAVRRVDMRVEVGPVLEDPAPGGLEVFLTARYGLHAQHAGARLWIPNWHEPWVLREARLVQWSTTLPSQFPLGMLSLRRPDHVMASDGVFTRFGFPQVLGRV